MAAVYSVGDTQYNVASGLPLFELVGVSSIAPKITEIQFNTGVLVTAAITTIGVGYPAASGVGLYDARALLSEDCSITNALLRLVTDWGASPPTAPSVFLRRISLGATASGGQGILRFPKGLLVPSGYSLVLWCIIGTKGNFVTANVSAEA